MVLFGLVIFNYLFKDLVKEVLWRLVYKGVKEKVLTDNYLFFEIIINNY